jgi:hypothetical protein
VVVDPKGFATVSLGNGVSVAFTASGMTTSYEGLPITNAGITLYAVKKDGSVPLGMRMAPLLPLTPMALVRWIWAMA